MTTPTKTAIDLAKAAQRRGLVARAWGLAGPYLASEERGPAWLLLGSIILLTLAQIALQVRFNSWNADFFNALEAHDRGAFHYQLGVFAVLATGSMGVTVYQTYLKQMLQLRWRRWLTRHLTEQWLANGLHYQLAFLATEIDNPDQRIAEDIRVVTESALDFLIGVINSTITFFCFIGILWHLSGVLPVEIFGFEINILGYMVWFALAYALIGSALTWAFGRPMIQANVQRASHEADFRFGLVRIREKSEEIAFYRGEPDELRLLEGVFHTLAGTLRRLFGMNRRLTWLTSSYTLGAMVFPALIASPRYFAGAITLGGLMQTTSAFNQVQGALSWFVENWPRLAEWRASVDRLLAFSESITEVAHDIAGIDDETITVTERPDDRLELRDLDIAHPDGTIIISGATVVVEQGERVLIVGQSGSGKSTLFRAIAGLWPWGRGEITVPPRDQVMFLPQRPYLPSGRLRNTILYPKPVEEDSDGVLPAVLDRVGLAHLIERLDDEERWDHLLSGGEQQRIAFARLLLCRPRWVFMDEATSALDDDGQAALMELFTTDLAGTSLLSIGHRPELAQFHTRTLELLTAEDGAHLVAKRYAHRRQRRAGTHPPQPTRTGPMARISRYLRRRAARSPAE